MKKEKKISNWFSYLAFAAIGIIVLLVITDFMCKSNSEFCSYEYKIFAIVLVAMLLFIRYLSLRNN